MAVKKQRRHAIYRFRQAFTTREEALKYGRPASKFRVYRSENQLAWSPWIVDEIVGYE